MIFATKRDLLDYFTARHLGMLERQFNADGRSCPVMIDAADGELLIATGPTRTEVVTTMKFPIDVSDFLGRIEIDRRAAEAQL